MMFVLCRMKWFKICFCLLSSFSAGFFRDPSAAWVQEPARARGWLAKKEETPVKNIQQFWQMSPTLAAASLAPVTLLL